MPTNIPDGLLINGQVNLNPKVYFDLEADLIDLGTDDVLAYTYYNNMVVFCVETRDIYLWRERQVPADGVGALVSDFTYPPNYASFGLEYSSKVFNFFKLNLAKTITPKGTVQVKKTSTGTSDDLLQVGDYVVNTVLTNDDFLKFGVYEGGDPLLEASYAVGSIEIINFAV